MSLPLESDFPSDPDGRVARDHFLGRSHAEAEALFLQSPYTHFDDLLWMGPNAFRFYVSAAVAALLNGAAAYEWGYPLLVFVTVLEQRLARDPEELRPIASELAAACGTLLAQWPSFGVEGFDDLPVRYAALQETLRAESIRSS